MNYILRGSLQQINHLWFEQNIETEIFGWMLSWLSEYIFLYIKYIFIFYKRNKYETKIISRSNHEL